MSKQIPEITESTKFNFITSIWIVPFIALVIAGWLAYQFFEDRGPEIEITFSENEGLIAGQSVLKFRKVPVGKVTKIVVAPDSDNVIVTVRMNSKRANAYLTEEARFWIVKPEVGLKGISGLDTLLSGTYLNVYSRDGGQESKDRFVGLSQPYRDSMEGEYFQLISASGYDVTVGTPVYYKNIKVGQVEYVYLSLDNRSVETIIFVDKQYMSLVHDNSKFWIKSMLNIDFSQGNLDVNIAPMTHLLQGGIVFSSPGYDGKEFVSDGHVFALYSSKTKAESNTLGSSPKTIHRFTLSTEKSTANLRLMAPVRFNGFDIGWIDALDLNYDTKARKMHTEITMGIDTSVFEDNKDDNISGLDNLYEAVNHGLRAKLDTLDIISGMLYIDLIFDHDEGNGTIRKGPVLASFPMVKNSSPGVMESMTKIMDKISRLPLDKLVKSLDKVINETSEPIANANEMLKELKESAKHLNTLTSKKSFETMPNEVNKALKELTKTLKSTRKVVDGYGTNSMLGKQLSYTLEILTKTSKEMEVFLRLMNRKPNSLIFGD